MRNTKQRQENRAANRIRAVAIQKFVHEAKRDNQPLGRKIGFSVQLGVKILI